MKVFHYADHLKWRDIKKGSWRSNYKPGLGAILRLGSDDGEAWDTTAVFALLEPKPECWTSNPYFKNIWNYLRKNIGKLLLEIDIDSVKDSNVFVVDRGHPEGFLYGDKSGIPAKYLHKSRQDAERQYVLGKIPLHEYLEQRQELDFALPEVIITDDVPLEKISIAADQPLLEESLVIDPENIFELERIPELKTWCERYREQHPELDELRVSGMERL